MAGMDISVEDALEKDRERVLSYTFDRLQALQVQPNLSFKFRDLPPRCSVGFGTYGWKYDPEIIREVVRRGSLIDTAEGYGYGRVETRLGKALSDPSEVTTKVRRDHMSPQSLRNAMMRSRLKLGITPHYQLHYPHHQYSAAILQLARFRQEGLIKSVGTGNCSVDQVESDQRLLSDRTGDVIRSVQVPFSLVDQRVAQTMIPYCQERGILVIAYSPLGQKFRNLRRPVLDSMARRYDATPAQVALAWILDHPGVMPIPRSNNMEHLQENLDAAGLLLSSEDVEELRQEYLVG